MGGPPPTRHKKSGTLDQILYKDNLHLYALGVGWKKVSYFLRSRLFVGIASGASEKSDRIPLS